MEVPDCACRPSLAATAGPGEGQEGHLPGGHPKHLTHFGQEASPDWALERKVTERPAHGDTIWSPPCPGHAGLVRSESAPPCSELPTWCRAGGQDSGLSKSLQDCTFTKRCHHSFWPCWVFVLERNVLLRNRLVLFPLCSGPNSPILEQCPGDRWGMPGVRLRVSSWLGLQHMERPAGPETSRGLSLQVTLALLKSVPWLTKHVCWTWCLVAARPKTGS